MAATKNASTKKKVAVVAKKSQEIKVRLNKSAPPPAAKVIPLPNDWPAASRPPALKSTDSALRPGSLLQEVCNGQDIHLNKQSLQAPSISKEKGRYLFILPGNMSFRGLKRTTKSMGDEVVEKSEDLVEKKSMEDGDDEEGEGTAKDDGVSSKIAVQSLGKIEGLSTLNPKLRVAFPDSNKALVFPGTKVNTLSKFMWLNCSGRKKGTVACKVRVCDVSALGETFAGRKPHCSFDFYLSPLSFREFLLQLLYLGHQLGKQVETKQLVISPNPPAVALLMMTPGLTTVALNERWMESLKAARRRSQSRHPDKPC
jgi:hypothetical protein